ncbi:MAG TPA: DEAD/DEAH box helicase [Puia sp.]|jgi:SWI/SNF-related matrix-associated actin-dependent regulator 1 of chromatin subfamily A
MEITESKLGFEVTFDFDRRKNDAINDIRGSWWNDTRKCWVIPRSRRGDLKRLQARFGNGKELGILPSQLGFEMDGCVVDKTLPKLAIAIPLKRELREYQGDGIAYNLEHPRTLIGDQQGLGKTIQAIASVIAQNAFPCLVICKSSLVLNWKTEIEDWTYQKVMVFKDKVKRSWPVFFQTGFMQFGICSYDSLKKYFVQSLKEPPEGEEFMIKHILYRPEMALFKSVIVDESHYIKDEKVMRTKLTVGLCLKKEVRYLLSGTPVLNSPEELFPQLVALGLAHHFGTKQQFKALYGKNNPRQKEALPYLNYLLHKHGYYRRLKSEVATDIPPKTRQVVLCQIDNREEYDFAENNFRKFLEERLLMTGGQIDRAMRAEALVQMMKLREISGRGKLKEVQQWMDDLIDQDEKVIVFGHHKAITKALAEYRPDITVRMCGSADKETLNRRKQRFQTDPETKAIVCSLLADSEGHTLTAASNVGLIEFPWHFGKAEQAEDRAHRIGTKYPVDIFYFLGEKTIDRKIYKLIMSKKDIHDLVTGTDEEVESKIVDNLINLFNQKDDDGF